MQKVSMYTIKTINMINCSLYMNNDSSYVILACDNAEFCSVSRRTKYYLLMMVMLLSCYYILYQTCCCNFSIQISRSFCFVVNLNGNMVVGNKFSPLAAFQKVSHHTMSEAHLTNSGMLQQIQLHVDIVSKHLILLSGQKLNFSIVIIHNLSINPRYFSIYNKTWNIFSSLNQARFFFEKQPF